jgi:hypothetical protein
MDEVRKLHRPTNPDTSREAAEAIAEKRTKLQRMVERYAKDIGPVGFTDQQMSDFFGTAGSTYRTRRAELTRIGTVVDSGFRSVADSGRRMVVWVHKDFVRQP